MSRYIDADKLRSDEIKRCKCVPLVGSCETNYKDLDEVLNEAPTADVVEVRHGEWEIKAESYRIVDDFDEELYVVCPYCKRRFWVPYELSDNKILEYARENYPYCHCGAKMDGERR